MKFKDDFSYDVILQLEHLAKGLGIKEKHNPDLMELKVAEKLGISSKPSINFRDWIIFNAREQTFEIVYGIRVEDLRRLISIDSNAPRERRRLAHAHIINAFSMCDAQGTSARTIDLQNFHGFFTAEFYPRRFALKDSIYFQRLDVLAALIAHVLQRYQTCLPPVKYCEFSHSVNDLCRPWVFDVLRSFTDSDTKTPNIVPGEIVKATKASSSFRQVVCGGKFSYLHAACKEPSVPQVTYKFLAGFNRQQVKSKYFKEQEEAIRLLSDSPQRAILLMRREIINSLNMTKRNPRATSQQEENLNLADFLKQLDKLKENAPKMPSFYDWVVGLDLFGDELGYPYCPFVARPFIEYIKNQGRLHNRRFGLRIHGGENVIFASCNSPAYRLFIAHMYIVFLCLRFLQHELKYGIRIGHGIAFEHILAENGAKSKYRKSSVLLAEMKHHAKSLFKTIAFEVNITSNEYLLGQPLRQGNYMQPLRLDSLFRFGIPMILATDDDGIWPIDQCLSVHPGHHSLVAEYCRAISSGLITTENDLQAIFKATETFRFWKKGRKVIMPSANDDDFPDDDTDANTIIIHPIIIKRIQDRYGEKQRRTRSYQPRFKIDSRNDLSIIELENENDALERVAFICVCANYDETVPDKEAKVNKIREEYRQLFSDDQCFDFIHKNWRSIRSEFMVADGDNDFPTPNNRVFITDSPLHCGKTMEKVAIHAFGPNMSNNEKLEELESFIKIYSDDCKLITLSIYTNNDKNKYNYKKSSHDLFKIRINPGPSKRDKTKENFLYALCEHASAATAALHCIIKHVANVSSRRTRKSDTNYNILDVFDSDMDAYDDFCNKPQINTDNKKNALYRIIENNFKEKNTDLITRLDKHRRVSHLIC